MGLAATLGPVGYGLGLLFFVPLGDVLERRGLILAMLLAVAASLLAVALSPGYHWFASASLALGLTTISPQLIVPLAATLARPAERGRVVGAVMSGLLVGVLASRTFSGVVAGRLGWRAVYLIAAGMSLGLAAALRLLLPRSERGGGPAPPARGGGGLGRAGAPGPAAAGGGAGGGAPAVPEAAGFAGGAAPRRAGAAAIVPVRGDGVRRHERLLEHDRVLPGRAAV